MLNHLADGSLMLVFYIALVTVVALGIGIMYGFAHLTLQFFHYQHRQSLRRRGIMATYTYDLERNYYD